MAATREPAHATMWNPLCAGRAAPQAGAAPGQMCICPVPGTWQCPVIQREGKGAQRGRGGSQVTQQEGAARSGGGTVSAPSSRPGCGVQNRGQRGVGIIRVASGLQSCTRVVGALGGPGRSRGQEPGGVEGARWGRVLLRKNRRRPVGRAAWVTGESASTCVSTGNCGRGSAQGATPGAAPPTATEGAVLSCGGSCPGPAAPPPGTAELGASSQGGQAGLSAEFLNIFLFSFFFVIYFYY